MQYLLKRFAQLFANASKVYFPVHTILLLVKFKRFKKNKMGAIIRAFKGWLKSCTFAAFYAFSIPFSGVYINDISGPLSSNRGFLISFVFSWFILFESNSRWGEMAIWVFAQWFEGMVISLNKRKLNPEIPHFSVRNLPAHQSNLNFIRNSCSLSLLPS